MHSDCTLLGTILQQGKLEIVSYLIHQSFEKQAYHLHRQLLPKLCISAIDLASLIVLFLNKQLIKRFIQEFIIEAKLLHTEGNKNFYFSQTVIIRLQSILLRRVEERKSKQMVRDSENIFLDYFFIHLFNLDKRF